MNALTSRKFVGILAWLLILSTAGSFVAMFIGLWHRSIGWEAVCAELLLVFVLGLEGIIAYGTFFREESVSVGQRRQLTVGLLEKFTSPEAYIMRAETWRIRKKWLEENDRSCMKYFVHTKDQINSPDEEGRCANGLTPHQNLSWLLHFYVSVQSYHEAGLLDGKLAATLLASHYEWYRKFFQEFCQEYRTLAPSSIEPEAEPAWLGSLPKLETIFDDAGRRSVNTRVGG